MPRNGPRGFRKQDMPRRKANVWDAIAQGAPDLVTDADLQYARATRGVVKKPKQQPERDEVQRPLVVHLRLHLLHPDSVVFAIPNLARSRAQTFALMRDGMLPGIPDLCVITRDIHGCRWIGFIEAKRPDGGSLSAAQKHVQAQIRALGFPVLSECRSVAEAVAWLREQGVMVR